MVGKGNADTGFADDSDEGDSGGGGEIDDTADSLPPEWITFTARLTVAKGAAVPDGAEVGLVAVAADRASVVCEVPLTPTAVEVPAPDESTVALWWAFSVEAPDTACVPVPTNLAFGVGELGPDARAQLGAVGMDAVADSLYGAYVQVDGSDVYLYGWAGTESDAAGDDPASFPAPDGVYLLSPLFLLALP